MLAKSTEIKLADMCLSFKEIQYRFSACVWQLFCKFYTAKHSMKTIAGSYKICAALNTLNYMRQKAGYCHFWMVKNGCDYAAFGNLYAQIVKVVDDRRSLFLD